jgi:hypothetical protein
MMNAMLRCLPLLLVGALLVADGYAHGLWTSRWGSTVELSSAAARLDDVPLVIGDWQGKDREPLSARELDETGFAGYVRRRYQHRQTGASVDLLLACGRGGPIAVHTPDVCYRGAGYQLMGGQTKQVEQGAEFWKIRAGKPETLSPTQLHIYWSWSTSGAWKAPDNPRLAFGGAPALYKLYLVHEALGEGRASDEVCRDFLGQLLPSLDQALGIRH